MDDSQHGKSVAGQLYVELKSSNQLLQSFTGANVSEHRGYVSSHDPLTWEVKIFINGQVAVRVHHGDWYGTKVEIGEACGQD